LLKNDIEKRFNVKLLTTDFLLAYLLQYLDAYNEKTESANPDVNNAPIPRILDKDFGSEFDFGVGDYVTPKRISKRQTNFNDDFNDTPLMATHYQEFDNKEKKALKKLNKNELTNKANEDYGIIYKKAPDKTEIIQDMEDAKNNNFKPDKNKTMLSIPNVVKKESSSSISNYFNKKQTGKGINQKDSSIHEPFGNYKIHLLKLKGNILHLSYPCGSPSRKIKPRYISNNFKEFLEYFLETEKFNENLYNQLTDGEKKHFYDCVKESGLYKMKDIKLNNPFHKKELDEMNRFDILRGEIEAGNDNPKMIHELKILLIKLTKAGKISRKESLETLEELTSLGF
jgi:hypothetical protein